MRRTRRPPPLVRVRRRIAVLLLLFTGLAVILVGRLAYVQLVEGAFWRREAAKQRLRYMPVAPQRGDIVDRRGETLATSISADAVLAIPAEIEDPARTAAVLAPLLGQDAGEILEKISDRRVGSVWLARRLPLEAAREIRRLQFKGIQLVERPERFYPNGPLAAPVLGFAGIDNQGLEGLEFYYDQWLRGKPGRVLQEKDASNRSIPGGERRFVPPENGMTVVLTLDRLIQYVAERELARGVQEAQAERGVFIAIDPNTGEILANAVYPGYDPNDYGRFPVEQRRNRAVTDQYEPGSTFKIVTGAAALAEGVVRPDESFFDPGFITIDGETIHCVRPGGHGSIDFTQATEVSCNVVYAQLSLYRLGPERFYRYIRAFGFGERTGVDFPGEAPGVVPVPGKVRWGANVAWATVGFGQGVTVTPLQLVLAASVIANGGTLLRPHYVKEIRDPSGRVVQEFPPEVVRRVLPEAAAREYARIMRSVVVNGSGGRAELPGYRVAGKTGTAEVAEGGRYSDKRIASFLGFAPVDAPRIAGIVVLYNVGVRPAYGGTWAAPVFRAIMEDVLPYLGVEPRVEEGGSPGAAGEVPGGSDASGAGVKVPNVRNFPLGDALPLLREAGLGYQIIGEGEVVMEQVPQPGARVPAGTAINLYLDGLSRSAETLATVRVPDLVGVGVREAAITLSEIGLEMRVYGSGAAVRQDPAAGTLLRRGETVTVWFEPPRKEDDMTDGSQ